MKDDPLSEVHVKVNEYPTSPYRVGEAMEDSLERSCWKKCVGVEVHSHGRGLNEHIFIGMSCDHDHIDCSGET